MDHAGNFPVSNGGVQLGQYGVCDPENPPQSHSKVPVPARTWDELVIGSAYPFDGAGGKAKYDSSDPRL
ncbi:hypothetical protein PENSUB_10975 [Penicillium subrubescens]|uniref:Uncharacterized protein n=1 Tax=Penicillium subrubescens TaxID=1316194 RepID=A0A1Q5T6U9_9EURO|nr:hypothetical protein PENSUB_10975 [Penicillium subrubescens]